MRRFVFITLVLLFFPLRAICQQVDSVAYIKIEQFKVANITLGSNLKAALKAFGKPDSIKDLSIGIDSVKEQLYYFNGVAALVSDAKVSRLECINPKYKTPQGLRVGNTTEMLFKVLGKTEIWKSKGCDKVQYALWPPFDTYMTFELYDNRITKIILDFTP